MFVTQYLFFANNVIMKRLKIIMWTSTKQDFNAEHVTLKLNINSKSCTIFSTDVQKVRRLQRHELPERVYRLCIRVTAVHYGVVRLGTHRPACHRQRSEWCKRLCRCKRRNILNISVANVVQLLLIMLSFLVMPCIKIDLVLCLITWYF